MEVIDKKSYSLYPVTRNSLGGIRAEYEQIPITFKTHIDSPIPIPDSEIPVMSSIKYNLYELDEFPTDQDLQYDTPEEMIEKLEEWGFDWQDFAEKICFFPKNSDENVPTSLKLAKGWAKDISPCWDAWDALGLGRSFRAQSGIVELSCDDQYFGLEEYILNSLQDVRSLKNMPVYIPTLCRFGLANDELDKTKYIWLGPSLMKTSATTPSSADIFSEVLHGTCPDFGSARDGSGSGNNMAGFFTGLTPASPYRGYEGFAIPVLFKVKTPNLLEDHIYGLIYFGYAERSYEGTISDQKYFISTKMWFGYQSSQLSGYYYTGPSSAQSMTTTIDEFFDNASEWVDEDIELPETDPYEQIQESENGGGDGTLDWTSDAINDDSATILTPDLEGSDYGNLTSMYNVYELGTNPKGPLSVLHAYMWSSTLLDIITKANADVRQSIISIHALPYIATHDTSRSVPIILCGQDSGSDAFGGVPQKEEFDLGSIQIKEFYGSYLDYSPYTSASIYLPFIGSRDLPIDQIMGKTVNIKYTFDNYNGNCVAKIYAGGNLIDCYNGQCSLTYPCTGADYAQKLMGGIMTIGGLAMMGGGLAKMAEPFSAAAAAGYGAPTLAAPGFALGSKAIMSGIGSAAIGSAIADKASVYRNGNLGGSSSWYSYRTPYITIISPRLAQPKRRNAITGKATCRTVKVGQVSGFNQFADIHVDQVICSDTERTLIKEALLKGVII